MTSTVSKKRKFGIPNSLSKGLSNTINMAENHKVDFKNAVVPISYIEPDPNNPRRMNVTLKELRGELKKSDKDYDVKLHEKEALQELSWSIQQKGLINPVTLYQNGDKYRLVAGERRYLASLLANKNEMEARIYKTKPTEKELKLVQWIENTAREDLCLSDRIANIESIISYFDDESDKKKFGVQDLMEIAGLSQSNAYRYLAILNCPKVRKLVSSGEISSLNAANSLAGIKEASKFSKAFDMYKEGMSIEAILKAIKTQSNTAKISQKKPLEKRGRSATCVNLGKVAHTRVVKVMVDALVKTPAHSHLSGLFSDVDWDDFKEVSQSFKKLLSELEREI